MAKPQEFQIPDGLKLPEGLADGDDFDALGTFRLKKDGMICLVEIDGTPLKGYDDKDDAKREYAEDVGTRYDMMNQSGGMMPGGMGGV